MKASYQPAEPAAAASKPMPGSGRWPESAPEAAPGTATAAGAAGAAWPSWSSSETAVAGTEGGKVRGPCGGLGTGATSCRPSEAHRP